MSTFAIVMLFWGERGGYTAATVQLKHLTQLEASVVFMILTRLGPNKCFAPHNEFISH